MFSRSPMCWLTKTLFSHRQGHGVFQMSADGQAVREQLLAVDRERGVPARPSEDEFPPQDHPEDGIVDVPDDRPVVDQKEIRDAGQSRQGLPLIDADRFVRQIAAGCDDGELEFPHQQMMERRVGEHHSQIGIVGSQVSGDNRVCPSVRWRRTIGDSGEVSSRASSGETEQICRICSSEEHIRAKGFSSRCFRARRVSTDWGFRASATR